MGDESQRRSVSNGTVPAERPRPLPRSSLTAREWAQPQSARTQVPQGVVQDAASDNACNSPVSLASTLGELPQFRPVPKLRNSLTPPLPRPLLPPPPPPPPRSRSKHRAMDNIVNNGPDSSISLDLNKLSLRFADDDDAAARLRLRPRASDESEDDEEYRLSVLDNAVGLVEECETEDEFLCFCGWVTVFSNERKKDRTRRNWLSLRGGHLALYLEETDPSSLSFECNTDNLFFAGLVDDNINMVCTPTNKKHCVLVVFRPDDNLDFWLLVLAKATCQNQPFVRNVVTTATSGGSVFIQQATTESWLPGWAFVQDRRLKYYLPQLESFFELDLRRANMVKKISTRDNLCPQLPHSHNSIQISISDSCIRLQAPDDLATEAWLQSLFSLYRNARHLNEYLVTSDNVPVIVERCIEYVSLNGLGIKGLYRKNASALACKTLLRDFKNNPFTFKILRINDETANVAADVMRSFFRQLPEPLISTHIHHLLYKVRAEVDDPLNRSLAYRTVLNQLPHVNYRTLRRLIEHLAEVTKRSEENLATVENLAKVFAPTSFQVEETDMNQFMSNIQVQICIMVDLLLYYSDIFPPTPQQIIAETKMVQMKSVIPLTNSDSKLVSVAFGEQTFQIPSNYSIRHVQQYFCDRLGRAEKRKEYAVFECLAEGKLLRVCADDEVVEHILVDKWIRWPAFLKDASLELREVDTKDASTKTSAFAGDVMFAEAGSKKFKQCNLKVESGMRIVCLSTRMKEMARWDLDQTVWFEGSDERSTPSPYCLTFFVLTGPLEHKPKHKYLGHCISFPEKAELREWLNCVQICKGEQL